MSKINKAALRAKVEWEGGIEATRRYGLRPSDIADPVLAKLWGEALEVSADLEFGRGRDPSRVAQAVSTRHPCAAPPTEAWRS